MIIRNRRDLTKHVRDRLQGVDFERYGYSSFIALVKDTATVLLKTLRDRYEFSWRQPLPNYTEDLTTMLEWYKIR